MKTNTLRRVSAPLALGVLLALGVGSGAVAQTKADDTATQDGGSDHPVGDSWITTKVKSELATTDGVKSMDISVKTVNGVVTLTGTQPSSTAIKKAVAAAKSVKGVKHVDASGLKAKPD
ncbi:MAG TPA: BON domain-containing protein [Dokdonella sp.]